MTQLKASILDGLDQFGHNAVARGDEWSLALGGVASASVETLLPGSTTELGAGLIAGPVLGKALPASLRALNRLAAQSELTGWLAADLTKAPSALSQKFTGAFDATVEGTKEGITELKNTAYNMVEGLVVKQGGVLRAVDATSTINWVDNVGAGVLNLTERGTLSNLRPQDVAIAQRPVRALVQDESGRYWLQSPGGNRITPSGSYDFVTLPDGTIRVARPNPSPDFSTHLGLSAGGEVNYAGSIRFSNNMGPNRGTITQWTNNSGHYQPPSSLSGNAGLPDYLFRSR